MKTLYKNSFASYKPTSFQFWLLALFIMNSGNSHKNGFFNFHASFNAWDLPVELNYKKYIRLVENFTLLDLFSFGVTTY